MENTTIYSYNTLNLTNYNDSSTDILYGDYGDHFDINNIDYSLYDYPKLPKSVPLWELTVKATVTAIVMLTAILGNALIVMVVMWNKSLRTTTNFFIVNLAISDILVTISCTWVHLVKDLTDGWILGVFFCKFNSFVQVVSTVTSILSMVLIACDRFFGIVFAMKAHIIERRARNSLIIVWIISLTVGMPMLFIRKLYSRQWKDHNEQWCDDEWPSEHFQTYRRGYWTFITVVLFFLPIVVMGGAYFGIIKTLWTAQAPGERLAKDVNIQIKVKRKVVMMLVTILSVFGVCWFPVQFSILYSEYKTENSQTLEDWYQDFTFFAYFFALSNSAINPIIYTAFNENFRKGFKKMFGCYKKKRYTTLKRMEESTYPSTITLSTSVTRM